MQPKQSTDLIEIHRLAKFAGRPQTRFQGFRGTQLQIAPKDGEGENTKKGTVTVGSLGRHLPVPRPDQTCSASHLCVLATASKSRISNAKPIPSQVTCALGMSSWDTGGSFVPVFQQTRLGATFTHIRPSCILLLHHVLISESLSVRPRNTHTHTSKSTTLLPLAAQTSKGNKDVASFPSS